MSSFLDLAGPDETTEARPAKKRTFLDLAGSAPKAPTPGPGVDVAGAPLLAQSPATQAAVLYDVQKTGAQNFTVNGAAPDATVAPVAVAQPAPAPVAAPAPSSGPTWWQKAIGAGEAGLATVTGATTGAIGGLAAGGNAAVKQVLYGATGQPLPPELQGPNAVNDAAARGAAALTYQPRTAEGQSQTEDLAKSGFVQSLPALGAHLPAVEVVPAARFAAQDARTSMQALQDSFAARKGLPAAERIEPTAAPVPGAKPTLQQAPPELQQAVQQAKASGKLNPVVVDRHVEAMTLPVPVRLTEGQASLDPGLISAEMNGRGKETPTVSPEFYKAQGQALAANMDAIRARAAPDIPVASSMVDHGQALIDAYKAMDEPIKAEISAKYKALADANGGSLPVNGQDFVAAADAALAKQMKGRYVPKEVAGDLETFRSGGPMTFEDFENMRTNLAAEGRKAERNGDGNAAGAINIVRNALESLPITGETAAIKPLADAARLAAKTRFDAIKADPAYKAAINDSAPAGEPSALADKFFGSYVTKGARANVARMAETLADDPIAKQTIAAGTLDQLLAHLKADPLTGNFSQDAYNRGLTAVAPKLDALLDPTTAQQVQAVGNVAKYAQAQPRGAYVNNSNTLVGSLASKAASGLEKAGNAVVPFFGLGTEARNLVAARAARNAAQKATAPGAGITRLSDLSK